MRKFRAIAFAALVGMALTQGQVWAQDATTMMTTPPRRRGGQRQRRRRSRRAPARTCRN